MAFHRPDRPEEWAVIPRLRSAAHGDGPGHQGQQAHEQDPAPHPAGLRGDARPGGLGVRRGAEQGLGPVGEPHPSHRGDEHEVRALPGRVEGQGAPRPQRGRLLRRPGVTAGRPLPRHQLRRPGGDTRVRRDPAHGTRDGAPLGIRGEGAGGRQEARRARRHIYRREAHGRRRPGVPPLGGRRLPHGEGADSLLPDARTDTRRLKTTPA